MPRLTCAVLLGLTLCLISGCGCGDHRFMREVIIVDHHGDESGRAHPIEVDTSALDPSAIESRKEGTAMPGCYVPKSELELNPRVPIKILIVPASQPSAANSHVAHPAGS